MSSIRYISILIVITLYLVTLRSSVIILPKAEDNTYLCNCLGRMLDKYTLQIRHVKVVFMLDGIYCQFKRTIIIHTAYSKPLKNDYDVSQRFPSHVIFSDENNLSDIFNKLARFKSFGSRGKMFLIYHGRLSQVYRILHQYNIYNVVILIELNKHTIELYTYFPYEEENFQVMTNYNKMLDSISNGDYNVDIDIFPNKLPTTWRNTSVKVLLIKIAPYVITESYNDRGFEFNMFEELARYLKFKVEYLTDDVWDWGRRLDNGSYTYGLGYLEQGRADLAFGLYHFKPNACLDFDHLGEYSIDYLTWVVPTAQERPTWIGLVKIFSGPVWILIVLTLFTTSSLWLFVYKAVQNLSYSRFKLTTAPVRILLENPSPNLSMESYSSKVLYLSCWTFSFIIITAYKAHLVSFLTHPSYEAQISNVQEMTTAGLDFGVYTELAEYYNDPAEGAAGTYIYQHAEYCDVGLFCLNRTAYTGSYMTASSLKMLEFLIPRYYLSQDGTSKLYGFEDSFQMDLVTIYCRNGLPFFEQLDSAAKRLRRAGIVAHLQQMTQFVNKVTFPGFVVRGANVQIRMLGIKDLLGLFWLLVVGLGISIIVFITELILSLL